MCSADFSLIDAVAIIKSNQYTKPLICMQPQNSNLEHQINTVKSNIAKIPALYQNDAAFIKTLNNANNISASDAIKIQTFFNLTQPAFSLLNL